MWLACCKAWSANLQRPDWLRKDLRVALLKGSVALLLQFKWSKDAGALPVSEMKTAVLPLLLSLAHRIGGAAQQDTLPVDEAVTLIHSIIQVSPLAMLSSCEQAEHHVIASLWAFLASHVCAWSLHAVTPPSPLSSGTTTVLSGRCVHAACRCCRPLQQGCRR